MAEASNNNYSRFLFTKKDGSPLKFRMTACPDKSRLRPLIEDGGGHLLLTKEKSPSAINLVLPTLTAKSTDLVSTTYIEDCIKENSLLDIRDYSVLVGGQYINQMDSNKNILSMQSRSKSGRHIFRPSEDVNIIRFLLEEERHADVNGIKMWKLMESLKIVNHSWQSTKDHFLKIILPNINSYGFSSEMVARFQKIGKPAQGSDRYKRAAKFSLEFADTGKDVEEDTDEEREDVFEDVDAFDQNLVQIAKSSENAATDENGDTVGKINLMEDADSEEGNECYVGSKYFQSTSGAQLGKKDEKKKTVKRFRRPKRRRTTIDDGDQERSPSAGQETNPDNKSATKAHSVEGSSAQGDAQNTGQGLRPKSSKHVGLRETKTQPSKAKKICTAEIAVADSQNDCIEDQDFPGQKKRIHVDSSTELETDDKSEEVFPLIYSGKCCRRGQQEMDVTLSEWNGDSSSETTNKRRSASPQPCTSKQILQEVPKKPKKLLEAKCRDKLRLRDFVMNDSLRENTPEDASRTWPGDFNSPLTDRQCIEISLTTCDKLMAWLGLSPETFVQAIYQCNGSVDCAIKWLLYGTGMIWQPTDDMDLFGGIEARLKVLQEKYSKEFVIERQNYLTENLVFL